MAVAILGVSVLLMAVTPVSYALNGHGLLSLVLFWFNLGGEGNVGAWWSGMLFLLAAICALDRAAEAWRPANERYGWAALGAALALLSFDEIASVHEFLMAREKLYLVPMGLLGLGLVAYALLQLRRAQRPLRKLLLAFALLATVPLQEVVQITQEWRDPIVYGLRALLEEGTEIAAALLLLAATCGGLLRLRAGRETFASVVWLGTPLTWLAVAGLPAAGAAVYRFNLPGVANWLGAALFLLCALLAIRQAALRREPAALAAAALYLMASLGSNAVRPDWDPLILGHHVTLRGLYFGSLLLAAPWVLSGGQPWRQRVFWLVLAGCTLLAAVLLQPHVIWSTWPATVAVLCFYIEIAGAIRLRAAAASTRVAARTESSSEPPKAPTIAGPV